MDLLYILGYYSTACVYFSFRWGPFVHSLGIVQWNFTKRDHPGNPGRVSGSGPVKGHLVSLLFDQLSRLHQLLDSHLPLACACYSSEKY